MYGYIYKTTNLLDGKIYIGQKKSPRFLGEEYLGSGKHLKLAVSKYGKENFKVELVEEIDSEDEMDNREIYWISYYNATDDLVGYNISNGGNVNRSMSGEHNPRYGHHMTEEEKLRQKEGFQRGKSLRGNFKRRRSEEAIAKTRETLTGHTVSQETREKLREYNLHKVYINDGAQNKAVRPEDVGEWTTKGWQVGRLKRTILIKDGHRKIVPECKVEEYKNLGYETFSDFRKKQNETPKVKLPKEHKREQTNGLSWKGKLNPQYGSNRCGELNSRYGVKRAWVTNGEINKQVKVEEVEVYLQNGFYKGRVSGRGYQNA